MFDKQQPIQKDKLHDQVYNRLCTMLRQGEFTPGEPVPVAHIADAFGISPMPVREALTRLLAKGVLTNVSGRSVGVPKVSLENLTDVRDVRLEVESVAVEWSIKNSDEKFIKDLKKLFEGLVDAEKRKDVRDFIRLNYEFHFRLYEQSRSAELMQIIDNLWLKVSPILYHLQLNDRFKVSNESHKAIIEAISKQDIVNAKAALAQDISWSYEDLISPLSRETSVEK
tara:strand:+ start:294 stop:971 length:678 start_codon:yes stop_codon:yes gene_type:complete